MEISLQPHLIQSIFLNDPGQLAVEIETSPLPDGPNFADEQRRTLLHAAAFCGNVFITQYLLEKGESLLFYHVVACLLWTAASSAFDHGWLSSLVFV